MKKTNKIEDKERNVNNNKRKGRNKGMMNINFPFVLHFLFLGIY